MRTPLFFVALLVPLASSAAYLCSQAHFPEFIMGYEFTVTNDAITNEGASRPSDYAMSSNPIKAKIWEDLVARVKAECKATKDCTTKMGSDKHGKALKVKFKDGMEISIGIDSSALESNGTPQTSSGYRHQLARMRKYFFELAKEQGLTPHERIGGGHIHITREAFEENSLYFRNFLVDFQNRPEIVFGALGNHLGNSAPLAALKPYQRDAFEKVLKDFHVGKTKIDQLIDRLHDEVFVEGYYASWGSPDYYQAFNMTRMNYGKGKSTLEIRSFRPQENVDVFLLQTYLLETWVNKIKTEKTPIEYIRKDKVESSPQKIVDAYADLLRYLELPWETFRVLLPTDLRSLVPTNH